MITSDWRYVPERQPMIPDDGPDPEECDLECPEGCPVSLADLVRRGDRWVVYCGGCGEDYLRVVGGAWAWDVNQATGELEPAEYLEDEW